MTLILQWSNPLQENGGFPIPLVWKYQGRTLVFEQIKCLDSVSGQPLRYDYRCAEERVWMFYQWDKPIQWLAIAENNYLDRPVEYPQYGVDWHDKESVKAYNRHYYQKNKAIIQARRKKRK